MQDTLGDRMKRYEAVTKILLPIRSYVIVRIDGCHFHTYTKGLNKPFDTDLIEAMQSATLYTSQSMQGCKLAYVQSDEASFLLTDFDDINTEAWYGNQLQKIVSVAASTFTAFFNSMRVIQGFDPSGIATFDARAFVLPDATEVMNYFLWRIKDAERNSLAGLCQANYSHKELMGKKASDQQELLFRKGINWNDYDGKLKRGIMLTPGDTVGGFAAPRDKLELLKLIPTKE